MTDLTGPDDSPTQPNLFNRPPFAGPPPPGFWDELRPQSAPPPQPAWSGTSNYSSGYSPDYDEAAVGIVIPSSGPDRGARRRGALMAVAGVVLATVVVVLATVVIGPHLGSGSGKTDNVAPPITPTGTPTSGSDPTSSVASPSSSGLPSSANSHPASVAPSTSPKPTVSSPKPSVATTTKAGTSTKKVGPAGVTTKTVGSGGTGSAGTKSSSTQPSVVFTTKEPTTTAYQPPPNPPAPSTTASSPVDFGVPTREIQCSNGLIVQLASELSPQTFQARVQSLQSRGQVPGDAAAATSNGSCGIFANQTNTYVLYSGPFGDLRDACNDRLSGPYDAYIKGGNPGTAGSFYSCICPARPHKLPVISSVGQTAQWIGELQRMLGAHLKYSVGGLDNSSWGVYTGGTQAAVQRFQADHHLHPNGVVDANTWAAIQSAGC